MGQVLYRKYRPKNLSELTGQEHVTKTLLNALKSDKLSHAYLFTGPKGVGKTSVARIMAHDINKLGYSDDSSHIDIIEIDAASNRRIDEIRELRDAVYMAPLEAKYKVYIIDEVHMLTKEAFNALLKTLEEPPQHVIFILATTDANKLPETIISRTQRYVFRPLSVEEISAKLTDVARLEKIKISSEAIKLLSEHSDGSLRDGLSLLDQVQSTSKDITLTDAEKLLGLPPKKYLDDIMSNLFVKMDRQNLIKDLNEALSQGFGPSQISAELFKRIKDDYINSKINESSVLSLLDKLIKTPVSADPSNYLAITLLEFISGPSPKPVPQKVEETKEEAKKEDRAETTPPKTSPEPDSPVKSNVDISIWPKVIDDLKSRHNTLYGIVRMSQPDFSGDEIVLSFKSDFHVKRLKEAANYKLLKSVIDKVSGQSMVVEIKLDKDLINHPEDNVIDNISSIFNGAEVIESLDNSL